MDKDQKDENRVVTSSNTAESFYNEQLAANKKNGFGIAGIIVSVVAVLTSAIPTINLLTWLIGAILSGIGLFKKPKGTAIAGAIISVIALIALIFFNFVWGSVADGMGITSY